MKRREFLYSALGLTVASLVLKEQDSRQVISIPSFEFNGNYQEMPFIVRSDMPDDVIYIINPSDVQCKPFQKL